MHVRRGVFESALLLVGVKMRSLSCRSNALRVNFVQVVFFHDFRVFLYNVVQDHHRV